MVASEGADIGKGVVIEIERREVLISEMVSKEVD
jgi:hypothetical protein